MGWRCASERAAPAALTELVAGLIVFAAGLGACSGDDAASPAGAREARPTPERIIALAPSLTETAFALGLGERVVGVGDYDDWPPEVAGKPRLGGLFDPNLEGIVGLDPDLAVLLPSQDDMARELERLGVDVLVLRSESLADAEAAITALAGRCGAEAEGERLLARLREGLAPREPPLGLRVMVTVGRPLGPPAEVLVAGPGTFYDELLGRLGAVNVFADAPTLYPQVGLEQVLARRPDAILEMHSAALDAAMIEAMRRDWKLAAVVPAVVERRIAVLTGSHTVIPGPRLPRLYAEMERALEGGP